jgi:hypothetical protein
MNSKRKLVLVATLALIVLCVLFPARRQKNGASLASRGFVFSREIHQTDIRKYADRTEAAPAEIDFPRRLRQCLLCLSVGGVAALCLGSKTE